MLDGHGGNGCNSLLLYRNYLYHVITPMLVQLLPFHHYHQSLQALKCTGESRFVQV
jgi:hypothetical protein